MHKSISTLSFPNISWGVLCIAVTMFGTVNAGAQTATAPDALVKSITNEVTAIVKQDKDIQAGNKSKIYALVDAKVLPFFDFTRMTQLAVGRYWAKATPDQQKELTAQFRTLLVRTYSTALASYRDQTIEFKPLRAPAGDSEVTVRTVINQPRGDAINIDYSMEKVADGWKVYDVAVGGVSLVTNYREDFGNQVQSGGIDGLIKTLATKNQGAAAAK
jgi:phospholipid transport system substrate-binding protein